MYPGTHAANDPDRAAVVMAGSGATLTYAQLEERSVRLANTLAAAGLGRGDTVALLTDNSIHTYEVYWAAMRSGLYLTAVNHHLSASEVTYIVGDSGATALIVSTACGELAAEVGDTVSGLRIRLAYGGEVAGYDDYSAALGNASAVPPADQPAGTDLLYSSGTTGRPKGIRPLLPQRQVDEPGNPLVPLVQSLYGFDADTVYLSPAPVYHAAPLRFGATVHALGGTVVMMEHFEPVAALWAMERYRITHSQWVPTMFVRMLKLDESERAGFDLSSHRVAVHAAAPCPPEVKQAMIDWWGPILHEYYSSTEGNGMTYINSEQWLRRRGSVGTTVLGTLHICDEQGHELPSGSVGTVYFERDELPFEYLNAPEKTGSAQHPGNPTWTTIGDLGYVDDDGYLYLTDRKSFMIISGGVNIYPAEIESVLTLHPSVADVAVIGVPDDEMGEAVRAVVQPAAEAPPGPELERALIDYVRDRIAHYKAPRGVDFVDTLPRTPTGKLVKDDLKKRYQQPTSRSL